MSKTREALEAALATLEDVFGKHKVDVGVINQLRDVLAEPEQEPVRWLVGEATWEREPAAHDFEFWKNVGLPTPTIRPLYTSPREWQELTEDEFSQLRQKCVSLEDLCSWSFHQGAMLAEGALRAKNERKKL